MLFVHHLHFLGIVLIFSPLYLPLCYQPAASYRDWETKKKRELPKYGRENLPKNLLRYEVTFSTKGLSRLFGRDIVAEELWSKQVFWTLVAEWFGYYEDMVKLPNDCWDADYRIFESAKDVAYRDWETTYSDRKSTRLNSSHITRSRMPSSA